MLLSSHSLSTVVLKTRERMAVPLRYDPSCVLLCLGKKPPRIQFHHPPLFLGTRTHPIQHNTAKICKVKVIRAGALNNNDDKSNSDSSDDDGKTRGREVAEALESLEEEAIAGEDEGRQPTDYNRRAHLFDACSKAFQDLNTVNKDDPPHDHQRDDDDAQTN